MIHDPRARTRSLGILTAFCVSFTAGCGNGDEAPKSGQQVVTPAGQGEYQLASCKFGFADGGAADPALAATPDIQTASFGKQFDFAPVHAVAQASARETVQFFETLGVHIYRVAAPDSACKTFGSLDPAPADFQDYWDTAAGNVSKGYRDLAPSARHASASLVGLYVERGSSDVASASTSAEIGVREDANRWTVVHEFLHHQFQTRATLHDRSDSQLKKDLNQHGRELDDAQSLFEDSPTAAHGQAMVNAYAIANAEARQIVIRFPLEEITIETFLQTHAADFGFFPATPKSSRAYIASSADKARAILKKLREMASDLKSQITAVPGVATSALDSELTADQELLGQITDVLATTGAESSAGSSSRATPSAPAEKAVTCGHARDTEELEQLTDSLQTKIRAAAKRRSQP